MLNYLITTPVASVIFALTIAVSLYTFSNPQYFSKLMLNPYAIHRDKSRLFTIFTSGLVHKDWMHLLFNMMTFYFFGFSLEAMFVQFSGPTGHFLFAGLYIVSLVLSDLPTIMQQKNNPGYFSLGASGAICAILFSFILFQPKATLGLFMIIPMPAYLFAFLFLGYCIWAAKKANDHINHDAHLFGALSGLAITLLMYPWAFRHFISQF
ncbi:rhomboid family intramembrane serine protease [Sphingobacterium sp. UT-1RO-CII-1]|uniref:rhomboid family intramembrane serine protease n=1 Tax=Sphingobacterium sp. UT-1RO-CII-1 TaxID=2995225 RepID=UPI00227B07F2|nr:rhomboid family intramembrane serine protease [Sphingobacterium sp. UT-1RO-CII-1]MCY4780857.1 rhomboid family intramembrane serine protease [Sphingobacterium sp. UT-1RO-CII-1]